MKGVQTLSGYKGLLKYISGLGSVSVFFLFKEPPYFTAEPECRILAEVEENVDIVCEAMGE